MVFRYDPALGALSLIAPRSPLLASPGGYDGLDPRLRTSPRFAGFLAERRHALLWVRLPPNDFCNYIPTHGHTQEHPILAYSSVPLDAGDFSNSPTPSPLLLESNDLPLSKKDDVDREPRQPFHCRPCGAASAP